MLMVQVMVMMIMVYMLAPLLRSGSPSASQLRRTVAALRAPADSRLHQCLFTGICRMMNRKLTFVATIFFIEAVVATLAYHFLFQATAGQALPGSRKNGCSCAVSVFLAIAGAVPILVGSHSWINPESESCLMLFFRRPGRAWTSQTTKEASVDGHGLRGPGAKVHT